MKEKRKYPRFDVVAKVLVKKVDEGDSVPKEAFVKNLSAEGFCFHSKEQYKTGEIIEIEIAEKQVDEPPICVKGAIAWSNKNLGNSQPEQAFLTGVKVLGIRKADEARFAMLYCERMLAELKNFLRL